MWVLFVLFHRTTSGLQEAARTGQVLVIWGAGAVHSGLGPPCKDDHCPLLPAPHPPPHPGIRDPNFLKSMTETNISNITDVYLGNQDREQSD